jgi:cytochrome oxidase Cu insertion factor (SCO1/SenC/PrrC family)
MKHYRRQSTTEAENLTRMSSALTAIALAAVTFAMCLAPAVTIPAFATRITYLPDIRVTDQNSTSISLSSLRGKPVLVGFMHTMCKGVCQMMTRKMRSVASALPPAAAADVTMLLITTDPADDRPQQLMDYARSQDLPNNGWILATGSRANIKRVMRIYGVSHEDTDDSMMHVMKMFLVAPDGSIAHVYSGMNASPQAVAADIASLHSAPTAPSAKADSTH